MLPLAIFLKFIDKALEEQESQIQKVSAKLRRKAF